MLGSRQRPYLKPYVYIIILVSVVSIFLFGTYVFPPRSSFICYIFSGCINGEFNQRRPTASRELTDAEIASRVVIREILKRPLAQSKNPKIAFMFLTPGPLPFEKLWHKFFDVRLHVQPWSSIFIFILFLLFNLYQSLSVFYNDIFRITIIPRPPN